MYQYCTMTYCVHQCRSITDVYSYVVIILQSLGDTLFLPHNVPYCVFSGSQIEVEESPITSQRRFGTITSLLRVVPRTHWPIGDSLLIFLTQGMEQQTRPGCMGKWTIRLEPVENCL